MLQSWGLEGWGRHYRSGFTTSDVLGVEDDVAESSFRHAPCRLVARPDGKIALKVFPRIFSRFEWLDAIFLGILVFVLVVDAAR